MSDNRRRTEEHLTCEDCGITSEDVTRDLDPYDLEINEVEIETDLCSNCYQERSDAI